MSDPLTPTLESLLGYTTDSLVGMSDEELVKFFAASLEVCPPVSEDYMHPSVVEKAMKGGGPDLRRQMEASEIMSAQRRARPSARGAKSAPGAYGKGLREQLTERLLQEQMERTKQLLKSLE